MAEDATQAGDDQQNDAPVTDDEQTDAGEDQQPSAEETIATLKKERDEANAEIERNNAFIKQRFNDEQQNPAKPEADSEPDDGSDEFAQYGLTKEQVKVLKKVTGADKANEKLAEYEKRDEARARQETFKKVEDAFSDLDKEFGKSGVPVPKTRQEKETFLNEIVGKGYHPTNVRGAFLDENWAQLQKAEPVKEKAAVSDRSDTTPPPADEKKKAAFQALRDRQAKGEKVTLEEIAQTSAKFEGDPTGLQPDQG